MPVHDLAIIGAGATGISLFTQVVRNASSDLESITLIDPDVPGTGVIFGDHDPALLCNTSAGIQSILGEKPSDFLDFCHARGLPARDADFVPRAWVGAYCRARYAEHVRMAAAKGITVTHLSEGAQQITRAGEGYAVRLHSGEQSVFSGVAICVGIYTPRVPDGFASSTRHPRLITCPYPVARMLTRVGPPGSRVLLAGSGLSAIDAAVLLCREGHHVTMASRSGVIPAARARILPHQPPHTFLNRIPNFALDDPLLRQRLTRAVVEAIRSVDATPLRHQFSAASHPVQRLREETAMAEAGLCHWQDTTVALLDGITRWTIGLPLRRRDALLAPFQSLIWRYVVAQALPNAQRLVEYIDAGVLRLGAYDSTSTRADDRGFGVALQDGSSATYDHVVAAAGFHKPNLYRVGDTVYLSSPPPDALQIDSLDAALRLRWKAEPERIWAVGTMTHIHEPFSQFLGTVTRQARTVAHQICDTGREEAFTISDPAETRRPTMISNREIRGADEICLNRVDAQTGTAPEISQWRGYSPRSVRRTRISTDHSLRD